MSNYIFTTNINKIDYDEFVKKHEYCNLLQSYDWATIKNAWDHLYTAVYKDGEIVATGLVLIRHLPMSFTMFYLPRGPILDYKNKELLAFYFSELKNISKKYHCLFIKFDPLIHVNDYKSCEYNENKYKDTDIYLENFKSIGAKHHGYTLKIAESAQPRFQSNVYYDENINENLPKHTKRLIKDADKREVKIICGGIELVDEFSRLVELTEERKNVNLRNKAYFELLLNTYKEDCVIFLATCNLFKLSKNAHDRKTELENEIANTPENAKKKLKRLEDQMKSVNKDIDEFDTILKEFNNIDKDFPIAGILSIKYGDTCEMLYAGMDERFKKFMPQYKEYVENFKWAFNKGCKFANMGGVEGTLDDGLTKFKDNFNPTINEFIGEFDLPVNKYLYNASQLAYKLIYKMRKIIRRLK